MIYYMMFTGLPISAAAAEALFQAACYCALRGDRCARITTNDVMELVSIEYRHFCMGEDTLRRRGRRKHEG